MDVQPLVNQPTLFITRLILLTDGTVMTGQTTANGTEAYQRLTPDASGKYVQGTWSPMASPQDPQNPQGYAFGASAKAAVMADGRVLFIGPDVSTTQGALIAAVYDPSSNVWSTPIATDSTEADQVLTCELADGTILCNVLHPPYDWVTGLFDLRAPSKTGPHIPPWHETPDVPAVHSVACWALLPDGSALSMGYNPPATVLLSRYIPHQPLLTLPTPQGMTFTAPLAAVLLPGGAGTPVVLCVGSANETALYYPYGNGLWEPGIPGPQGAELGSTSRPACLEPSGKALVLMPTITNSDWPWELFECNGSATVSVTYSSVPSPDPFIVSRLSDRHRGYLDEVSHCPTQFQEHIEGCDYRVHVVGDEVFACRIESTADDYRYPDPQVEGTWPALHAAEVPLEIAQRCIELGRRLRLALVGIDLRLTPAGRWVAFEANPSPAFSYYEQATGLPIAASVARLLARR